MTRAATVEELMNGFERDPSGCWLWTGKLQSNGYAKWGSAWAHRAMYERLVGPIPKGLQIDHLCRVKHCVNPEHLDPVTHAENMRRWSASITHCPVGHPYDEANTKVDKRGCRACRTCGRTKWRRRGAARSTT